MTEPSLSSRAGLAEAVGQVGVWTFALDRQPAEKEAEFANSLEEMGFKTLWIPEGLGSKEALAHATYLLSQTRTLIVATGIASIYARDAYAMANGARLIADAYPGRFVLGIGVSHSVTVEMRGHAYGSPLEAMRAYLDGMEASKYGGPQPQSPAPRVLAALGPRMLRLAAERTAGAHTYFVPVEHTPVAREQLGDSAFLSPEQAAVVETDPEAARTIARKYMAGYIDLPNYRNNLTRLGWSEDELSGGGSDRLVDALIAWGDAGAIAKRVREHLDAGADHVSVQLLRASSRDLPTDDYRALADALA